MQNALSSPRCNTRKPQVLMSRTCELCLLKQRSLEMLAGLAIVASLSISEDVRVRAVHLLQVLILARNKGAGVPLTSGQLYSAGHTDDLRQALMYISSRYPKATLFGVGFSLGANVIIRYISEEGERSRLRAVCALGCVSRITARLCLL